MLPGKEYAYLKKNFYVRIYDTDFQFNTIIMHSEQT